MAIVHSAGAAAELRLEPAWRGGYRIAGLDGVREDAAPALVRAAVARGAVEARLVDRPNAPPAPGEAPLEAAGFARWFACAHVARDLDPGAAMPELATTSLVEVGRAAFAPVLARALLGSPNRYLDDRLLADDAAGDDASWWSLVRDGGTVIGVILPRPRAATLAFAGLIPEARGRGLGRALHVSALALLARAGVRRYRDTTDVRNAPMLGVLRKNGCVLTAISRFYRHGEV